MIISPIFYMGNKKKLIKKGLVDLFPKNIDTFYELFSGSAIVSMNTKANKYVLSDTNDKLIEMYQMFKDYDSEHIINHVDSRINEYGLPRERTKRCDYKGDISNIEKYKANYFRFRKYYNENKKTLDMYTLMFFAFSQQFRFNSKGDFNMPFGNDCFTTNNKEYIRNGCDFFINNVEFYNKSFSNVNIDCITNNDFVYLDPPYLNTTATYNENEGWTMQDEETLYKFCEELNNKGIKFGISNVFSNKGITNDKLIKWCEDNNWNLYTFDKMTYYACGKGNANTKEVYICNY